MKQPGFLWGLGWMVASSLVHTRGLPIYDSRLWPDSPQGFRSRVSGPWAQLNVSAEAKPTDSALNT